MKSVTFIPSDILKPYIKYFIISEEFEEKTYKVLPGTALVLGFQYKGRLSYFDNNNEKPLAASGITGLQDTFRIFKNSGNIGTVLVFFNETGASFFFKEPVNELFSESLPLDNFIKRSLLDKIEEQLSEAGTDLQRIGIVEQFLISQLQNCKADILVSVALQHIFRSKGTIRIADLANELHISQSPLEKRFRKIVGASPKKYASIVRFRAILDGYAKDKSLTEIGFASGYFDQAHFIKDFKLFAGDSPEKYFGTL